ncbi:MULTISPECIES: hypothetical protein [unclassified Streptomyces]|uniref:hypothetical protein n=1 Tax=unclassified Streptomyces TaxID=2593676 RepID=UPI002DDA66F3|nr:hypothetical protein [Streptomyces sp. NBC_01775]WSB77032.1 hypothetical protein OHB04_15460 [Streptomyces sp. NBC_01775]WSS43525.1 hypothetical protein OG220_25235 [Streptomyces sp. NBC_01187]
MNFRGAMKTRRGMTVVALAAGLVLTTAGCGGGGDGGDDAKKPRPTGEEDGGKNGGSPEDVESGKVLAEVKGGEDITLTVNSARRESGGFVTVTGKVTNGGGKVWVAPGWEGSESELALRNKLSVAGAKLVDKKGKKRYLVLRDTEGHCLCTSFGQPIQAGKSKTWYAQFPAPPDDNNEVEFQIADMPPAGVQISGGE